MSLQQRIVALGTKTVIPTQLLDGANELRFLGNDAAHIEAKQYQAVGNAEGGLAIDLALELLHATYQTARLVERLRSLKNNASP